MDQDDIELNTRLCTRAGMIMEDASVVALETSGFSPARLAVTISELEAAADTIAALVKAAASLSATLTIRAVP